MNSYLLNASNYGSRNLNINSSYTSFNSEINIVLPCSLYITDLENFNKPIRCGVFVKNNFSLQVRNCPNFNSPIEMIIGGCHDSSLVHYSNNYASFQFNQNSSLSQYYFMNNIINNCPNFNSRITFTFIGGFTGSSGSGEIYNFLPNRNITWIYNNIHYYIKNYPLRFSTMYTEFINFFNKFSNAGSSYGTNFNTIKMPNINLANNCNNFNSQISINYTNLNIYQCDNFNAPIEFTGLGQIHLYAANSIFNQPIFFNLNNLDNDYIKLKNALPENCWFDTGIWLNLSLNNNLQYDYPINITSNSRIFEGAPVIISMGCRDPEFDFNITNNIDINIPHGSVHSNIFIHYDNVTNRSAYIPYLHSDQFINITTNLITQLNIIHRFNGFAVIPNVNIVCNSIYNLLPITDTIAATSFRSVEIPNIKIGLMSLNNISYLFGNDRAANSNTLLNSSSSKYLNCNFYLYLKNKQIDNFTITPENNALFATNLSHYGIKNIFCDEYVYNAILNCNSYLGSVNSDYLNMTYTNIPLTWTTTTNGVYNKLYNIYIYNNYVPEE